MHSNFGFNPPIISQTQRPTMYISPPAQRQERLEKGIKYFSSKMFLVQLVLGLAFAIPEIIVSQQYGGQCPVSPNIPLFLLVHGLTKIAWVACGIIAYIEAKFFLNSSHIRILMLMNLIIQIAFLLFFLGWFIAINVWVWSVKSVVQTTDSSTTSTYCQGTLYSAAQGLVVSTYIVVGIIILLTIKRRMCPKKRLINQNS